MIATIEAGEQAELALGFPQAIQERSDYLQMYPTLGRPFGSYSVFEPSETPDIGVLHDKVRELFASYETLTGAEFTEGFNLRGENAVDFTQAIEYRDVYEKYHGKDMRGAPVKTRVEADRSYEHFKHHLGRLLDGGEQALPTGPLTINGRDYFNARIDGRSYFFVVRPDGSMRQFTGLVMEHQATHDEWFDLGGDILLLAEYGPTVQNNDGYDFINGSLGNPANWDPSLKAST